MSDSKSNRATWHKATSIEKMRTLLPRPIPDRYRAEEAINRFQYDGNYSLIVKEVRAGNPALHKYAIARELIANLMEGKAPVSQGERRPQNPRNVEIVWDVAKYVARGLALSSRYKGRKIPPDTACSLVGQKYNLSPDAVSGVWKNRVKFFALTSGPELLVTSFFRRQEVVSSAEAFIMLGKALRSNPHKDWSSSPSDIYWLRLEPYYLQEHGYPQNFSPALPFELLEASLKRQALEHLRKKIGPVLDYW